MLGAVARTVNDLAVQNADAKKRSKINKHPFLLERRAVQGELPGCRVFIPGKLLLIELDDDTRRDWAVVSAKGQHADSLRLPPGVLGKHRRRQQLELRGRRDDRINRTVINVVAGAD